ncbi:MAG: hypothetical protein HY002_22645 [Candidatus Rokubacteria bacterium]|nr:hypothetical protein [Candidatus Rokubacteria bacterium]
MTTGILVSAFLAAAAGPLSGQAGQPVTRTFGAPMERTLAVVESVLRSLGWSIDDQDKSVGWILTNSRGVDFKDWGVYGEGSRHKLRLTLKAAGEGQTAVSVERDLYKEERILWMKERKPLQATDRTVELGVLDEVGRILPAAAP